jgi:hypothetical protein
MTKTRVFAIFRKILIEVSNLKLIFQEVLTMRKERSKQRMSKKLCGSL